MNSEHTSPRKRRWLPASGGTSSRPRPLLPSRSRPRPSRRAQRFVHTSAARSNPTSTASQRTARNRIGATVFLEGRIPAASPWPSWQQRARRPRRAPTAQARAVANHTMFRLPNGPLLHTAAARNGCDYQPLPKPATSTHRECAHATCMRSSVWAHGFESLRLICNHPLQFGTLQLLVQPGEVVVPCMPELDLVQGAVMLALVRGVLLRGDLRGCPTRLTYTRQRASQRGAWEALTQLPRSHIGMAMTTSKTRAGSV